MKHFFLLASVGLAAAAVALSQMYEPQPGDHSQAPVVRPALMTALPTTVPRTFELGARTSSDKVSHGRIEPIGSTTIVLSGAANDREVESNSPARDDEYVSAPEDLAALDLARRTEFDVQAMLLAEQGVDRGFREDVTHTIEQALSDLLVDAGDIALVSTDCRMTACRLDLMGNDPLALQDVLERLQDRLVWTPDIRFDIQETSGAGAMAAAIVPGP